MEPHTVLQSSRMFLRPSHHVTVGPTNLGLKRLGPDGARHHVCEGGLGARLRTSLVVCHHILASDLRGVTTLH
jgi:hypothetical protein